MLRSVKGGFLHRFTDWIGRQNQRMAFSAASQPGTGKDIHLRLHSMWKTYENTVWRCLKLKVSSNIFWDAFRSNLHNKDLRLVKVCIASSVPRAEALRWLDLRLCCQPLHPFCHLRWVSEAHLKQCPAFMAWERLSTKGCSATTWWDMFSLWICDYVDSSAFYVLYVCVCIIYI
jgi:hypothetical protein